MKKTALKILAFLAVAAIAFTVVHLAVTGNNTPTNTAFTFSVTNGKATLTGSEEPLSGAVLLPDEISGYPVTGIGDNAFKDCSDVTAFFLPDSIRSIGKYAFENCTSLSQAILPGGLTQIGEGAFWNCSSLVSVTVPTTVTEIGSCAFYKCTSLESLVIPGTKTPVRGIFNVALDIGQTLSIMNRNNAASVLDPIVTTVYCYKDSNDHKNCVAYYDALADSFSTLVLLDDCTLTSYTVRYTDGAGNDVATPLTLDSQPAGIRVAAVAVPVEDPELVYPASAVETIELAADAQSNVITFEYTARSYTVTFDANGGAEKQALAYLTTDTAALGDTTRTGYTFKGWQVAEASADAHYNWGDVGTTYTAADTVEGMYGDVTLKAVWEGNSIIVTYDAQGGTADAAEKVVTFGDTYGELAGASREGYTFSGWYSELGGGSKIESSTTVANTQDHTLYARWAINHYDVTVTTDGNGTAAADLNTDVEYGATVTLTAQANPGYSFSAWESDDVTVAADGTFTVPAKDVTVKAVFAANTYTLTFDTDGGDAKTPLTYKTTDTAAIGSATKAGYTLTGWRVSAAADGDYNWGDIGTLYTAADVVTGKYGDATLTAIWEGNDITVTYNAQGGTPDEATKTVTVGGVYGELAGASREGYTFSGWYTAAEDGTQIAADTPVTATADHEIYAYWAINHYDVTVANDGNGTGEADPAENVAYGTTVTLTAAPKPGYSFFAWTSDDVTVAADGTFVMPAKDVTVKATFAANTYTITYDTDGGADKAALTYKLTDDDKSLGMAEKEGYTFLGWSVKTPAASGDYNWGAAETTYSGEQSVLGKYGDVTLKALWMANNITVTYDAQGGSTFVPSKSVTVGGTYGTLANATREGYTFAGWFTAAEGGTQIVADTPVTATANHTIYAHWTINHYNVTVTDDGHGTASAAPAENVAYGTTVTLTAEAARGYVFSKWESSSVTVAANGTFTMPDKAVTVKAVFEPITYVIAFDSNGGENTMDPIDATYDVEAALPANAFTRTGFEFLGWATTAGAETVEFADEAPVKNLTAAQSETVTLYALWKDIKVELIAKEGSTTIIDNERGFIYGLAFEMTEEKLNEYYLDVVGNGHLEYEYEGAIGTGSIVRVINDNTGETAAEYAVVLFGDVNGDGLLNTTDAFAIRSINARLTILEKTSPYYFAADLNHDGEVGLSDISEIRSVNARLKTIDQVWVAE